MSRKGNCRDNAVMERFFLNLKRERVWRRDYANPAEARADIADYIVGFYNGRFDAPWKPAVIAREFKDYGGSVDPREAYWGFWSVDGDPKPVVERLRALRRAAP